MSRLSVRGLFRSGRQAPAFAALPLLVAGFGVLALLSPLGAAEQPLMRVGALLITAGALEILHGVRRDEPAAVRRAIRSGVITVLMGALVISAPFMAGGALVLFLSVSFLIDGVGHLAAALRQPERRERLLALLGGLADLAAAALLLATRRISATWLVTVAAALRVFGSAWSMAVSPVHRVADASKTIVDDLGIGDRPEAAELRDRIAAEENSRAPSDRRATVGFIATLFAIHIARMAPDGTLLGLVAPGVALLGDMLLAILFAVVIVIPVFLSFRKSTRWLERWVWQWYLPVGRHERDWRHHVARAWLANRLRIAVRLRQARYSIPSALMRSLAMGLPVAAIVAASVPVWGMSWFFDTENWASGIWNSWAEARTDKWREAMVHTVTPDAAASPSPFAVVPPGLSGDFAFIVIGDTGEGDASQHALRDQLLAVADHDDVRFLVISSDVVYPNGSMNDYEAKFWLPFKGVKKPVYAIPGNHDWYDALEAFLATFLEADAARATMQARARADLKLTSTTSSRIDGLISEAARLRLEYEVPTGFQRGPFFELQADRFALVAIDTGIVKRLDPAERAWLDSALERARGKFTMAILGHPFYAGGYDQTGDHEDFAALKQLLIGHGVSVVMAGDTHDLEYYFDPPPPGRPGVHYFVNGGGGAYMSFGTALDWPPHAATREWAYYPDHAAVAAKIEARTPWWKRPAWWWTRDAGAWPFSAEWLSAVFDYNVAPFFQSFFEVRVEPSEGRVRLLPYGVHGRLRWKDLAQSPGVRPAGVGDHDPVEWLVPMR
ncbi:MAG: hypothetical protein DMF89_25895 [Acidobacteria bacterium]|nr:MAG: hypothetical protein DMF89_25895 [Acidobacteriota bacterium]